MLPPATYACRLLMLSNFGARGRRSLRNKLAIAVLTLAGVIFRSEVALLLAMQLLWLVTVRRVSLWKVILPAGVTAMTVGLLITVTIDSFFWQKFPIWPEWIAFRFNTIEGKSSDWGTSPWHFYFINAIPRLILNPLCLMLCMPIALMDKLTRRFSIDILAPLVGFVAVFSFLPHKEWRFILYVIPSFTAVASAGAAYIWNRRRRSYMFKVLSVSLAGSILGTFAISMALLSISSLNYPGAHALQRLHHIADGERPMIRVHLDNLACQTGVSRFLQMPTPELAHPGWEVQSVWHYDKTEDESKLQDPGFWERFDYIITENPSEIIGKWDSVERINGFAGISIIRDQLGLIDSATNAEANEQSSEFFPATSWEAYQQRLMKSYAALEKLVKRRITRGLWIDIKMRPKLYVLKKQDP